MGEVALRRPTKCQNSKAIGKYAGIPAVWFYQSNQNLLYVLLADFSEWQVCVINQQHQAQYSLLLVPSYYNAAIIGLLHCVLHGVIALWLQWTSPAI